MNVTSFSWTLWVWPLVMAGTACASHAQLRRHDAMGTPIVVRVFLQTDVEPPVLARATILATAVLRHAGAEPEWLISSPRLGSDSDSRAIKANDLIVRIVAIGAQTRSTTCGMAIGHLVTIFANCVNVTSAPFKLDPASVDPATVYAFTIVHEIGHVLLPRGHSIVGIMRAQPDWNRAAQNTLDFTSDEIVKIRRALAARLELNSQRGDGASAR